jgi:hypothetical protein
LLAPEEVAVATETGQEEVGTGVAVDEWRGSTRAVEVDAAGERAGQRDGAVVRADADGVRLLGRAVAVRMAPERIGDRSELDDKCILQPSDIR